MFNLVDELCNWNLNVTLLRKKLPLTIIVRVFDQVTRTLLISVFCSSLRTNPNCTYEPLLK